MKKLLTIISLTGITAIIGLLNWYATPTMSDDLMYRFVWQEQWQEPLELIQSIQDVIKSQMVHYEYTNGRSLIHGMAQMASILLPDSATKLLNTAMFLLLIYLITIYSAVRKENKMFIAVTAFGLLFLVISGFYTGFIWIMGAFNYLWVMTLTLCFLLLLRRMEHHPMNWKLMPLIPLSFLIGWTHEAIALPMSVSFIACLVINRKTVFQQAKSYCMIAYTFGIIMILFSPALWSRADIEGIPFIQRMTAGCINLLFGIRISWLLILTLIIILVKDKDIFYTTINRHKHILIAWITAIGIVFCCGTNIERVPIFADFIALLIVLDVWQSEKLMCFRTPSMVIICIACVLVAIPAIRLNYKNYQNYLYHQQQLITTDNRIIKVRQLPADLNKYMKLIAKRYVNPTIEFNFYNCYMAFDQHDLNNRAMAHLYHKDKLVFLPEDVINHIEHDSLAYQKMESDEHQNLYILQLNKQQTVKHVTFLLDKEAPLKFYQWFLSYPGNEYELDNFNYKVINIQNRNYLVMTIPTSNINRRIKQINIE